MTPCRHTEPTRVGTPRRAAAVVCMACWSVKTPNGRRWYRIGSRGARRIVPVRPGDWWMVSGPSIETGYIDVRFFDGDGNEPRVRPFTAVRPLFYDSLPGFVPLPLEVTP